MSPKDFKLRFEETAASVDAVMEAAATTNLPAVTTRLILYRDQPCADLEITLHDKPFDPWPEAGWLCLPLNVNAPQFRLGRLGSIIDPAHDIVTGANRHMFGINTGVSLTDAAGHGVGFCPMDYPLVSLDTPGCWRYSLDFVPKKPVAYVNLFNNQWDTNFRLWNRGTWTSRVRLWAIRALRRRSFPHHAFTRSAQSAARGSRRRRARRIAGQPARPGAFAQRDPVTAYGSNPDGPGTVLRLWELAGKSGTVKVRLPEGTNAKQVQPVDLRGRPLGKPIPVKNGSFKVEVGAFAPSAWSSIPQSKLGLGLTRPRRRREPESRSNRVARAPIRHPRAAQRRLRLQLAICHWPLAIPLSPPDPAPAASPHGIPALLPSWEPGTGLALVPCVSLVHPLCI